ncbi:MAG: cellulase family glycosylhydrolase [Bacteroidales bacterium]|nr:cellulase family glycosylhydrolase [Bacteroidales bacterium]
MKTIFKILLSVLVLGMLSMSAPLPAQTPFSKGVNLTGWLQTSGIKQVQFTKYTRQDFVNISSLGCDVVRLPIDMTAMTNGSPDYVIDPLLYMLLDSVVAWSEELHIYLILDNHTMDPGTNTSTSIAGMLDKIWVQLADHYKGSSDYILYELRNEPHGISTAAWAQIELNLINSIRAIDTVHTIVIGASGWNSYSELSKLPVFADTNLIYTFHFYDPFLFTHQGATWPTPSMGSLAGVPFPYDSASMPACPADLKGTWIESSLANSYKTDGTVAKVKQLIDQAVTFKNTRNVNVFCGEFGVYDLNSDPADRVAWYDTVRVYLEEKGIPWTIWDYHGGFGIFNKGGKGLFESDLNIPLVNALGFTAPEQHPYEISPDTIGFSIYKDFVQEKLLGSASASSGIADFFSTVYKHTGSYSIEFSGVSQYNNFAFDMSPDKDLSYLKDHNYFLEFYVKATGPQTSFDVRFIDTKTGPDDHPWRMRRIIGQSLAPFDGEWHYVKLPLSSFTEHGSWDNAWFNPIGAFDWTAIDRLEFVAEEAAMGTNSMWFDDISITDTTIYSGINSPAFPNPIALLEAYPNPVSSSSIISYRLQSPGFTELTISSITGQTVGKLRNTFQQSGTYNLTLGDLNISDKNLSAGIYVCSLKSSGFTSTIKLIVH